MPRHERPLSPHLQIYRIQITSGLSILHRLTGLFLVLSLPLIVWSFHCLSSGEDGFNCLKHCWSTEIGKFVFLCFAFSYFYHALNGVRHLIWDVGCGMEPDQVTKTGVVVIITSLILTILLGCYLWTI